MVWSPDLYAFIRLGKSGLIVPGVILECISYGSPGWLKRRGSYRANQIRVRLGHENGIQTFNRVNVNCKERHAATVWLMTW